MAKTLNVLFIAAEADPFIKVGGLGDVAGSLPRALRALPPEETGGVKLDVRLVLPLHNVLRTDVSSLRPVANYSLPRSGADEPVQAYETQLGGMPVYFISGEPIAASGSVYSNNSALDGEKYAFFSLAALGLPHQISWHPDVIHANDWHTALAVYAMLGKRWKGEFEGTASLLTLHNLPFMGSDMKELMSEYGLPELQTELPGWARALPLPLGLWAADGIVPVSPTYAREIMGADYGCGLEGFLHARSQSISGILNGIDIESFDPATDESLISHFDAKNLSPRETNKNVLRKQLGLAQDPGVPLLAVISRMDPQKGIDVAFQALRKITDRPWQAVILGTGDLKLEEAAQRLQVDLPERVRAELRYDSVLARRIYAGADMLLMPSRYEPCGLAQMIAMRYGCIPVVRATGGLNDTVQAGETGFTFEKASARALIKALRKALDVFPDREIWQQMQLRGMAQDYSWANSARQYALEYQQVLGRIKPS